VGRLPYSLCVDHYAGLVGMCPRERIDILDRVEYDSAVISCMTRM
jgi:hypothetical protein